jgi:replicative superfamily II helicase
LTTVTQLTVGDILLKEAEESSYFGSLYQKLLRNYTAILFDENYEKFSREELKDLLKFADIFSKSNITDKINFHRGLAQDIVITLSYMYKNEEETDMINFYEKEVLLAVSNYVGVTKLHKVTDKFQKIDILSHIAEGYKIIENKTNNGEYLLDSQRIALNNLFTRQYYSFSAPTSMGKTFIIKNFIKQKITDENTNAIAIIIPTKALINELEEDLIQDLSDNLLEIGYVIATIPTQLQILNDTKKILLFTPERILQAINESILPALDYIFIDEAQKVFESDERSPIYYKLMRYFNALLPLAKIFFSSPYTENPEELLRFITNPYLQGRKELSSSDKFSFSPVSQKQFLINDKNNTVSVFNPASNNLLEMKLSKKLGWCDILESQTKNGGSIVYCKSKADVIEFANQYSKHLGNVKYDECKEVKSLMKKIKTDINEDYYLIPLLEKKIAFHMGIMPSPIRKSIEKLVKDKKIDVVFCTSTLLEGVNLPAVNIFIMSHRKGTAKMSLLDFKNLIGRAGRIRYSLWGNAFLIDTADDQISYQKYKEFLSAKLERNDLTPKIKGRIKELIPSVFNSNYIIKKKQNEGYEAQMKFVMYRNLAIEVVKNNETNSIIYETYKKEIERELDKGKSVSIELDDIKDMFYTPETIQKLRIEISKENIKLPTLQTIDDIDELAIEEERKEQIGEIIKGNTIAINEFLIKLSAIFDFPNFESDLELGKVESLIHYSAIASRWILGQRLSRIILARLWYHKQKGLIRINKWDKESEKYTGSQAQNNIIINGVMSDIEDIVTYKLSKYVRKFVEIYKSIMKDENECNFADYLDYGTTNETMIKLQKIGISRELAKEIYKKKFYEIINGEILIQKWKLLENKEHKIELELLMKNLIQLFKDKIV